MQESGQDQVAGLPLGHQVEKPAVGRPLASLEPRNRELILRYLEGQSVEDIAAHYKLQPASVSVILKSPLAQQMTEKYSTAPVRERIEALTGEAVDTVRDLMRGKRRIAQLDVGEVPVGTEHVFKAANLVIERSTLGKRDEQSAAEGLGESLIRAISKRLREQEHADAEISAEIVTPKVGGIPTVDVEAER